MYIKPAFIISDSDVLKITEEAGYSEAIEKVDYVAPLFWPEDFMNDCYKTLCIDDRALDEAIEYVERALDPRCFDEEEHEECVAREYIIKALRKYCKENNIETDCILVDVSW